MSSLDYITDVGKTWEYYVIQERSTLDGDVPEPGIWVDTSGWFRDSSTLEKAEAQLEGYSRANYRIVKHSCEVIKR